MKEEGWWGWWRWWTRWGRRWRRRWWCVGKARLVSGAATLDSVAVMELEMVGGFARWHWHAAYDKRIAFCGSRFCMERKSKDGSCLKSWCRWETSCNHSRRILTVFSAAGQTVLLATR